MFDIHAAGYRIADRTLLQATTTRFVPGQVCGLIGHNGSGKSTLLKLLARQQAPSDGEIYFAGHNITQWRSRAFARQVAYLPQSLPPTEHLTGRELIAMGRYPWHGIWGRPGKQDLNAIEQALELTQTQRFADRLVDTLSGGERQRVWLAMLLAQGSQFLLLDEPLAALDIAHQVDVLALIQRLTHELGLGVIIVLHDINMAARYCDRLLALHSGKLLADASPEQLMDNEMLHAIYGIDMHIVPHPTAHHRVAVVA